MRGFRCAVLAVLIAGFPVFAQGLPELADVAVSGTGTETDPYILDAAGWDTLKGGPIAARGVFEVAHGALLDVASGTRVLCESGQFRLPPSARANGNPMFRIDLNASGVEFRGCEFHPGVTWMTTGPCAHLGSTDTTGGTAYIQVGNPGDEGAAEFRLIGNTFHPPRIVGASGVQVKVWAGTKNARVEDNVFELSVNMIAFAAGHDVARAVDENLIIRDNVFDGLDHDATTCIDTDDAIDFEIGAQSVNKRVSNHTLIAGNTFRELGPPLHWHVSGEQLRFTGNTYYGGTTHFLSMTTGSFDGITIDGNNCYGGSTGTNPGGCDIEITGTARRINVFGNHLDTVIDDSGLIASMLTLNGTLTDMLVHDNYLNGNRVTSTVFDCISLGRATNVQILDNVCVDITDFVHLKNNGTNVLLQGNVLHSDDPDVPEYILRIDAGTHTAIRAVDNHMTGFASSMAAWTNAPTEVDYEADNTWQTAWEDQEYVRIGETFAFQNAAGTRWTFEPGGTGQSLTWVNPGVGHTTTVLTSDNKGGVDYVPALVVDRLATTAVDPDNSTDGLNPWENPTNAYGLDMSTVASAGKKPATVYEQRYDWSDTTTAPWHLEVTWDAKGDAGCSTQCTFSVLVCTDKPCDPDTVVDRVSWTKGQSTGIRRSYHDFGVIDPSSIEVKVRWINDGAGGPLVRRTAARVYGVQLTDAPYSITMPDALKKFIDIGADPPATCSVGDIWIDTDTSTDLNCVTSADYAICVCHTTDSWGSAN